MSRVMCPKTSFNSLERGMDGWITEFYITFAKVRPNKQAGIMAMRRMALVTRTKIMPNMAAPDSTGQAANGKGNFVASPLAARRPIESGAAMLDIIFVLVTSAIRLITVIPACLLGLTLARVT